MSLGAKAVVLLLGLSLLLVLSCTGDDSTTGSQGNAPLPATIVTPLPTSLDPSLLTQNATDFVNRQAGYEASGIPAIVGAGDRYLIAIPAICETGDGYKCAHTFFFLNERFLRTDTSEKFAGEIQVMPGGPSRIEIRYNTYGENDQFCCPSITGTVVYWWTSSFLQASGIVPLPLPGLSATAIFTPTRVVPATATFAAASVPLPSPTREPNADPTPVIDSNAIPVLQSVGFQSAIVTRGGQIKLDVTITNTARVNGLVWKQPSGETISLGLESVERTGNQYTISVAFPADVQLGSWQIVEIQLTGGGSVNYTFLSASHFTDFSPCPSFQNLGGGMGCTTSLLDVSGKITVRN